MLNIRSDFMTFTDAGYFCRDFGLIFVHGLLPLVSLVLSHCDFFVSFQQNTDFF